MLSPEATLRCGLTAAAPQGVDRWQLNVQQAADNNLDKFELYVMKNVFSVPDSLSRVRASTPGPAVYRCPHQDYSRGAGGTRASWRRGG